MFAAVNTFGTNLGKVFSIKQSGRNLKYVSWHNKACNLSSHLADVMKTRKSTFNLSPTSDVGAREQVAGSETEHTLQLPVVNYS